MRKFLVGAAVVLGSLLMGQTGASAATSVVITDTSSPGMDFSQTRAQGHYEFLEAGGIKVWTENNTSLDKVAGYIGITSTIEEAAGGVEPSMSYTVSTEGTYGPWRPGYQLVAKDQAGRNFILVGETVYGNKWWAASCSTYCASLGMPSTGGGGSPYQGTLDEWAAASPGMTISAIGFSLGSGAYAKGTLNSLTYGKYVFTFKKAKVVEPTTTSPTTTSPTSTSPTTTTSSSGTQTSSSTTSSSPTGTTSATTSGSEVQPVLVTNVPKSPVKKDVYGQEAENLAYTGASDTVMRMLWIGFAIMVLGGLMIWIGRKRKPSKK